MHFTSLERLPSFPCGTNHSHPHLPESVLGRGGGTFARTRCGSSDLYPPSTLSVPRGVDPLSGLMSRSVLSKSFFSEGIAVIDKCCTRGNHMSEGLSREMHSPYLYCVCGLAVACTNVAIDLADVIDRLQLWMQRLYGLFEYALHPVLLLPVDSHPKVYSINA